MKIIIDLLEKINVTHLLIVVFVGVGTIISVLAGAENIATAFGTGLIGFLGGTSVK